MNGMTSKLISASIGLMLAFQVSSVNAGGSYGVPGMKSGYVRDTVIAALKNSGCKITKRDSGLGVMGDKRHKKSRGGASCHNQGKAIDIFPRHLSCDNPKLKGKDKLRAFRKAISTWKKPLLTICGPDGEGACIKKHNGHIHIGAVEALGCRTPY